MYVNACVCGVQPSAPPSSAVDGVDGSQLLQPMRVQREHCQRALRTDLRLLPLARARIQPAPGPAHSR